MYYKIIELENWETRSNGNKRKPNGSLCSQDRINFVERFYTRRRIRSQFVVSGRRIAIIADYKPLIELKNSRILYNNAILRLCGAIYQCHCKEQRSCNEAIPKSMGKRVKV